ncbi:MAG: phytanoyl-CoA dioxygenase family protein [Brevundimonas sp.]|uniref:phytanoyl-CoA dioxygenase family protein n=1 Tax=Brevundimonas sp. TaxID=1871086 RepID=UPI002AB90B9A|nr:phytanoyl-CoA dioxygenase family protein [Brevundimonas sp.]MDZ4113571.1 phytanoyl-CoA dioxygenase family protein [Brevundimonas sp.]
MTSRRIFRDAQHQALFDAQGYVVVPFLDDAAVERLSHLVPEFCPPDIAANCFDDSTYLSSYDSQRRAAISEFVQTAMGPRLMELLSEMRVWTGTLLQRQPGAPALVPHQHLPSTADLPSTGLVCWCPLFDCDEDGGALQVIPGSHKLLRHVMTSTSAPAWQRIAADLPDYLVTLKVKAGEAVLFSESIIHGSGPTQRRRPRVAMVSLALPVEATPALHVDSLAQPDHVEIYRVHDEFAHSDAARGVLSPHDVGDFLGAIPANRVALNRRQFEALLANASRVASGVDPYLAVADLADPPTPRAAPAHRRLRRFVSRHIPARVKARLRALV